ncbi:hypothetical protein K525DRAFT_228086 [Schizophyllum commune Loenen D]|nr:hypothetical protein K525DRAFT_228086 [Schizophyllum commune Loenen D]
MRTRQRGRRKRFIAPWRPIIHATRNEVGGPGRATFRLFACSGWRTARSACSRAMVAGSAYSCQGLIKPDKRRVT